MIPAVVRIRVVLPDGAKEREWSLDEDPPTLPGPPPWTDKWERAWETPTEPVTVSLWPRAGSELEATEWLEAL